MADPYACPHEGAYIRNIGFYQDTWEVEIEVTCRDCGTYLVPQEGAIVLGPPCYPEGWNSLHAPNEGSANG